MSDKNANKPFFHEENKYFIWFIQKMCSQAKENGWEKSQYDKKITTTTADKYEEMICRKETEIDRSIKYCQSFPYQIFGWKACDFKLNGSLKFSFGILGQALTKKNKKSDEFINSYVHCCVWHEVCTMCHDSYKLWISAI